MNHRNNNRGVGRLTGRVEVDAGIIRYRQLLAKENHAVTSRRGARWDRFLRLNLVGGRWRKAAGAVAAALLLALVLSIAGAAEVVEIGCLQLSPGLGGGAVAVSRNAPTPEIAISDEAGVVAVSSGSLGFAPAGWSDLDEAAPYSGELCCGPYRFAP